MVCLKFSDEYPLGVSLTAEQRIALVEEHSQLHPTEAGYFEDLVQMLMRRRLVYCKYCFSKDIERKAGERTGKCGNCRRKIYLTANTFLERVRKIVAWHFYFWLKDEGIALSANQFAAMAEVSQSSASEMRAKLALVVTEEMPDDSWFVYSGSFLDTFSKRSKETPAREHPREEQTAVDQEQQIEQGTFVNLSTSADSKDINGKTFETNACLNEDKQEDVFDVERSGDQDIESEVLSPGSKEQELDLKASVYELLTEQPIHFDKIGSMVSCSVGELSAALMLLELDGIVERLPGDFYVRVVRSKITEQSEQSLLTEEQESAVEQIGNFIKQVYHGISRKHLQLYIAEFWFFADRAVWQGKSILEICLAHGPVRREPLQRVTPFMVKVMPGQDLQCT